jgi:hypothetical protein
MIPPLRLLLALTLTEGFVMDVPPAQRSTIDHGLVITKALLSRYDMHTAQSYCEGPKYRTK